MPLWSVAGGLSGLFDVIEQEWRREGWTVTCSDISHPCPSVLGIDGCYSFIDPDERNREAVDAWPGLAWLCWSKAFGAFFRMWLCFFGGLTRKHTHTSTYRSFCDSHTQPLTIHHLVFTSWSARFIFALYCTLFDLSFAFTCFIGKYDNLGKKNT